MSDVSVDDHLFTYPAKPAHPSRCRARNPRAQTGSICCGLGEKKKSVFFLGNSPSHNTHTHKICLTCQFRHWSLKECRLEGQKAFQRGRLLVVAALAHPVDLGKKRKKKTDKEGRKW